MERKSTWIIHFTAKWTSFYLLLPLQWQNETLRFDSLNIGDKNEEKIIKLIRREREKQTEKKSQKRGNEGDGEKSKKGVSQKFKQREWKG